MKTEFMLLACYEKPLIPLEVFCADIMGVSLQTARNRVAQGTFPVPYPHRPPTHGAYFRCSQVYRCP